VRSGGFFVQMGDVVALVEGVEGAGVRGRRGESRSAPRRRSASTPADCLPLPRLSSAGAAITAFE